MPLVEGVDLQALLAREGAMPAARAVGIVGQVADALDAAHGAGLVHRAVKPSNVLVTQPRTGRDVVYLIDFGIAGASDGTPSVVAGTVTGSPTYMVPERFSGSGDRRSDVHAPACVLHETLTGVAPFIPPTARTRSATSSTHT